MFQKSTLSELLNISYEAGDIIMNIYKKNFKVNLKRDNSPVTIADKKAEELILGRLNKKFPNIPIISEEAYSDNLIPNFKNKFFLVDPLDGTKEFVKKNDEFTVNIAFVNKGISKIGFINVPAKNIIYFSDGKCSYSIKTSFEDGVSIEKAEKIKVNNQKNNNLIATISKSHSNDETEKFLKDYDIKKIKFIGSSYKFCLVASGKADIYPRMSPTCEWDTAAGHAILRSAGGKVTLLNGEDLKYGFKKNKFINPSFIARN